MQISSGFNINLINIGVLIADPAIGKRLIVVVVVVVLIASMGEM